MAETFKVWVHVERVDEEAKPEAKYEDLGNTGEFGPLCCAHLNDQEMAKHFATALATRKAEELMDGFYKYEVHE